MGIGAGPRRRIGDADPRQRLDGAPPGLGSVHAVVGAQHLGDLFADGEDRVEGRQGLLEDHRDARPPDTLQGAFRERQEIGALEMGGAPGDAPWRRHQAQQRERRDRLAAAAFADQAEDLARIKREGDAIGGLEHGASVFPGGLGGKGNLEAAHLDDGAGGGLTGALTGPAFSGPLHGGDYSPPGRPSK